MPSECSPDGLSPAGILRSLYLRVGVFESEKHDTEFLLRVEVIVLSLVRTATAPSASGVEGTTGAEVVTAE